MTAAAAAQDKVETLTALVGELGPKIEQLGTQIRSATQELNKNKATLETAAAIRHWAREICPARVGVLKMNPLSFGFSPCTSQKGVQHVHFETRKGRADPRFRR